MTNSGLVKYRKQRCCQCVKVLKLERGQKCKIQPRGGRWRLGIVLFLNCASQSSSEGLFASELDMKGEKG